jgi:outer membrane biosynthesis protein TonB
VAFESVRSYVQLASGLGELTKAKAMDAAQGLLALPGADEVTRRAVQASTLADQLLDAARANRANLLTLIQGEVESALKKADVARVADVDAARAALTAVTKEIADLRALLIATGASAVAGASRSSLARSVGVSGAVTTAHRRPAASAEPSPVTATPRPKPAATKSTVKPAAPATKTTAKRAAPAKKAAAAKKATAKRAAPAKKASAAKKAPARKAAPAKKTTTAKATTAKATTAKKAST